MLGAQELMSLGARLELCTEDGTLGARGTVMDLLREADPADILYGCGPPGMLRALCRYANATGVPCQISMEETFGCSMGTCWGCVVAVRRGSKQGTGYPRAASESRDYDFARVCADGTVFYARDVRWGE
jgi:dihydroorotate dehydrogenase electron transfer subunit